jgi:hypothetical protein
MRDAHMATLTELLPALREQSSILVTGPQRSGTTIGGRILAAELGRTYVDEEDINIAMADAAAAVLSRGNIVLQAPGLCHLAHNFDCAVVLMRRRVDDIVRSQQRIGWGGHEHGELVKYGVDTGPIAAVKYRAWDDWQKSLCKAPFELDYESLCAHGMWMPAEQRVNFGMRQWTAT